jgi:hypothetical protein
MELGRNIGRGDVLFTGIKKKKIYGLIVIRIIEIDRM